MTPITFPDAAGAFTLPLPQAAAVLDMPPVELLDLTRAGCTFALIAPTELTAERPPMFYAPGLLAELRARLEARDDALASAEIRIVARALRGYLTQHRPVGHYDQAIRENLPVLGRNNSAHVLAHIQQTVLADWVRHIAPLSGPGAFAGMPSHTAKALERLGCVSVRGVRALADGKQRWHTWWRIPRSMWSPSGEWDLEFGDWPALQEPAPEVAGTAVVQELYLADAPSGDAR